MHLYYPDQNPQVDSVLNDIVSKFNLPPPQYKLGQKMPQNVLAEYDTDTKMISFGSATPPPYVVAHEACLPADTNIRIYDESKQITVQKPIGALPRDFSILSFDQEAGMTVIAKAFKTFVGKRQTFKIRTKLGRSIVATEEHRFFTTNGLKALSELKVGDSLVVVPQTKFCKGCGAQFQTAWDWQSSKRRYCSHRCKTTTFWRETPEVYANRKPWNKGLTKESNKGVALIAQKLEMGAHWAYKGGKPWNIGIKGYHNEMPVGFKERQTTRARMRALDPIWREHVSAAVKKSYVDHPELRETRRKALLARIDVFSQQARESQLKLLAEHPEIREIYRQRLLKQLQKRTVNKPSGLELDFKTGLSKIGISEDKYVFQHPLGVWLVDFAFLAQKLAVELDGDFWHSRPEHVVRDRRKDTYLKNHGWRVLRIRESEFRKDEDACLQKIIALVDPPTWEDEIVSITLDLVREVYDITVPAYEKFLLGNGILSHNSHYLHDQLGSHCTRSNCENFAYMFEKMYGNYSKLYRMQNGVNLKHGEECPVRYNRVYLQSTPAGNAVLKTIGVGALIGSAAGLAHYNIFHKGKRSTAANVMLLGVAFLGGTMVVLG